MTVRFVGLSGNETEKTQKFERGVVAELFYDFRCSPLKRRLDFSQQTLLVAKNMIG